jgi:phage baseplate assembly protein W
MQCLEEVLDTPQGKRTGQREIDYGKEIGNNYEQENNKAEDRLFIPMKPFRQPL